MVKPVITNTRMDMSPYEQSMFAGAIDAAQTACLIFDVLINRMNLSKMRLFLSDVMFNREDDGSKSVAISFGKQGCAVFRKVMNLGA